MEERIKKILENASENSEKKWYKKLQEVQHDIQMIIIYIKQEKI